MQSSGAAETDPKATLAPRLRRGALPESGRQLAPIRSGLSKYIRSGLSKYIRSGLWNTMENIASKKGKTRKAALDWYGGPYDPDEIGESKIVADLAEIASR